MASVAENLKEVRADIPDFKGRIIAVTKYVDESKMIEAYNAGLRNFGENKAQDAILPSKSFYKKIITQKTKVIFDNNIYMQLWFFFSIFSPINLFFLCTFFFFLILNFAILFFATLNNIINLRLISDFSPIVSLKGTVILR